MRYLLLIMSMLMLHEIGSAQNTGTRTEEYAVLSAWQTGRKTRISVQVGSMSTPEKEFEMEKGDKRFDMGPVILEMEKLNALGFELVTGNSAIVLQMSQGSGSGIPYYTFIFKRSIP